MRSLKSNDSILPGQEIVCSAGGSVVADFPDGTSLTLEDGTAFFPTAEKTAGLRIELRKGNALFSVAKQNEDRRMEFGTPHGGGEVLGTVFSLNVSGALTKVRTFEGEVRVWNSSDRDTSAEVSAGHSAVLSDTVPLAATSFDVDSLQPGEVAWFQDFNHRFESGHNAEARFITEKIDGQTFGRLESIPADSSHHERSFRPDQWLTLEYYNDQTLFVVPENLRLSLRLKGMEKGGYVRVALSPSDPEIQSEHVITQPIYLTGDWQDVELSTTSFQPYLDSRLTKKGLPIRSVAIWGFEAGVFHLDRIEVRRAK